MYMPYFSFIQLHLCTTDIYIYIYIIKKNILILTESSRKYKQFSRQQKDNTVKRTPSKIAEENIEVKYNSRCKSGAQ